jgi:hypothetical protein
MKSDDFPGGWGRAREPPELSQALGARELDPSHP